MLIEPNYCHEDEQNKHPQTTNAIKLYISFLLLFKKKKGFSNFFDIIKELLKFNYIKDN